MEYFEYLKKHFDGIFSTWEFVLNKQVMDLPGHKVWVKDHPCLHPKLFYHRCHSKQMTVNLVHLHGALQDVSSPEHQCLLNMVVSATLFPKCDSKQTEELFVNPAINKSLLQIFINKNLKKKIENRVRQ